MSRQNLIDQLQTYQSFNEQEEADRKVMLDLLETTKDIFYRTNLLAHFTASAWVLNKAHTHVLMAFHNIFQSYAWLGGHADGEEDTSFCCTKRSTRREWDSYSETYYRRYLLARDDCSKWT